MASTVEKTNINNVKMTKMVEKRWLLLGTSRNITFTGKFYFLTSLFRFICPHFTECIPKSLRSNFLRGVELLRFMLRIASEQYGQKVNLQEKYFWNDIYPRRVDIVWRIVRCFNFTLLAFKFWVAVITVVLIYMIRKEAEGIHLFYRKIIDTFLSIFFLKFIKNIGKGIFTCAKNN